MTTLPARFGPTQSNGSEYLAVAATTTTPVTSSARQIAPSAAPDRER